MPIVTSNRRSTIEPLLEAIWAAWEVGDDGKMRSKSHSIFEMEEAAINLLNFSPSKLAPTEFAACARSALRSTAKLSSPNVASFEDAFRAERANLLALPISRFYVVTRCQFQVLAPSEFWMPLDMWGARAVLSQQAPAIYKGEEFFLNGYGRVWPHKPEFGCFLTLGPIAARSKSEALDSASANISTIFGLISFYQSVGISTRYIGAARALTPMLPGPAIILYDQGGERIEDKISYSLSVPEDVRTLSGGELERLLNVSKFLHEIGALPPDRLTYARNFIHLYYEAISEVRAEDQLTGLWKAAEYVTFSQGKRSVVVSKRLSSVWSDKGTVHALCEAVGHQRNLILHSENTRLPVGDLAIMFRSILDQFFRRALAKKMPSLSAWRTAVELVGSEISFVELEAAVPVLKGFGWDLSSGDLDPE